MHARKPKAERSDYIPFLERFSAWWNGTDAADLQENSAPDPASAAATISVSTQPQQRWPEQRLAICERLWGEGFIFSGGPDYMEEFVKPLCLNPTMSVMDFTAGAGGGPAEISKKSDIWITAMESDPELAAAATEFCARKGAARAKVTPWKLSEPALPAKKYDRIYGRECFYLVEDKSRFLAALVEALKPGGQLLFSDYVLADGSDDRSPLKNWRRAEAGDPLPWTIADCRKALKQCQLEVRICADDTDSQRQLILSGWSGFVENLKRSDLTTDFVDHMMLEATIWLARMRAFEDGQLQWARMHVTKPPETL